MVFYTTSYLEGDNMNFKKSVMYTLLGGLSVLGYMKYKDGSMKKAVKKIKPKVEDALTSHKK